MHCKYLSHSYLIEFHLINIVNLKKADDLLKITFAQRRCTYWLNPRLSQQNKPLGLTH
ncbi:hypothetical protein HCH_03165 [Hahella chejuensis KCTC 2396]|uniref:Uncharacterized protein n=1 Tax=Hahella chejuensis (strain KCTC 2396) TaxID=349521 RepID=Q2SHE6_HAHCH|nr:hypothetical protein HCH_03165 [Hahella chejuensis KCTC 2396]